MNISILTVFPDLVTPFLTTSLVKKATEKGLVTFDVTSYLSFVAPKERIDAPTFGHGAGMLIKPDVVEKALAQQDERHGKAFKIFFSPQGKKVTPTVLQSLATILQERKHVALVCSRYEGMDARVEEEYADMTLSIGDFVVMGGEVPAMLLLEGLLRFIPGVIGRQESVEHDSFSGPFVDHPEYTEPVVWHGQEVPDVVRSGNHAALQKWREEQAAQKTILQHFDWFRSYPMNEQQKKLGASYIPSHYIALMHTDVIIKDANELKEGTTSVTSLDIHDIARSARTYGLKQYFIVTRLKDQQKVVQKLLDFWQTGVGIEYNPERYEAVKLVNILESLDHTIQAIEKQEGQKPLLIATSAKTTTAGQKITYFDQAEVWKHKRPVLFVFGTGRGLAPAILERCDYVLIPVKGFSDFNHLSVRSAAAIIFDRWLGWYNRTA